MIYDCFLYNGEDDQVAMRMEELAPLEPIHVAVQGDRTFQGEQRAWCTPPPGVRDHRVWLELGDVDPWTREEHQREAIRHAIPDAPDDAFVIVSDADEIPRCSTVAELTGLTTAPTGFPHGEIVQMHHAMFYFALDLRCPWGHDYGPVVLRVATLRQVGAQRARTAPTGWKGPGGWHFSYLGGPDAVLAKMQAYSHTEFADLTREQIAACIRDGQDYGGRGKLEHVPIDDTYPACIRDDPERWKHLMWENVR